MISIVMDKVDKAAYSTFKSVEEMRDSVNQHVKKIQESGLSAAWQKKLIRLLDYLRDISREFPGLSFRKQRKIAAHFGLKKPDTVGIWIKKLAELGIVKILPTKRSCSMHQTANFVQILPAEIEKRGQAAAKNTPSETKNGEPEVKKYSKTKAIIHNTYSAKPVSYYQQFKNFISSKIGMQQKLISKMYGVYKAQTAALTKYGAYSVADIEHVGYQALMTAVMETKSGRIKNLPGFYNGVLDRMLDRFVLEDSHRVLDKMSDQLDVGEVCDSEDESS